MLLDVSFGNIQDTFCHRLFGVAAKVSSFIEPTFSIE
jgi:hypothetical protein